MENYQDEIKEITKDLVCRFVKDFCKKIKGLDKESDFVRDDYVRRKRAGHHIMSRVLL